MGDWMPDPTQWTGGQRQHAGEIISSGRFKGDPAKLATLQKAVDWYDQNVGEDAPDTGPDAPFEPGGAEPSPPEAPAPQAPAPAQPPAPQAVQSGEGPWYERFLKTPVMDTARGMGQGITSRWGDELAARLTPEATDDTGIPREYAAGSATADITNSNRDDNAQAKARSPWLYGGGEVAGVVAQNVLARRALGGAAPAAKVPLSTAIPANAAMAGQQAFVTGAGGSEQKDPLAVLREGSRSVAGPALLAGGLTALGGAAPALRTGSNWLRGKAIGAPPKLGDAADVIGHVPGESSAVAVGRKAEEFGLPASSKYPMTGAGYADAAAARADDAGTQLGIIIDRATANGAKTSKVQLLDELTALRDQYAAAGTKGSEAQARLVDAAMKNLDTNPVMDARTLQNLKANFMTQSGAAPGQALPDASEVSNRAANRGIAGVFRNGLSDAMPDNADRPVFDAMNKDIGAARSIQQYGSGAEGESGIGRAFSKAMLNKIPGGQALSAGIDYGEDMGASALKGASNAAAATGRAAVPVGAMTAPAASNWSATHPGWLPPSTIAPPIEHQPANPKDTLRDAVSEYASNDPAQNARGQLLPDVAMQLMKQPGAFGKWQQQLFDARKQGEGQFAAELTRLQADPEFQATVLPKLQAMTAQK